MKRILSKFEFGDMVAAYITDEKNVGLLLTPVDLFDKVDWDKEYAVDSLVQVKILGDGYAGCISNGITMRNSESVGKLRYIEQHVELEGDRTTVSTHFETCNGQLAIHKLAFVEGYQSFISNVTYENDGDEAINLEMLASFSFGCLTPFEKGDTPATLRAHRIRARWSSEGKVESMPVEDLMLIPSWCRYDQYSEKFGQTGSKPVNRYYPFAAIEDTKRQVLWGVQLCAPASWQLEFYNKDDSLCMSGGLADYDFGHWLKTLEPGEKFTTPDAYISVCKGDLEILCHRLTAMQELPLENLPKTEEDLPVQFNEWATSWGVPTHESMVAIAENLKNRGVKYLVIDAGWYKKDDIAWDNCAGDWEVCNNLFPEGLKKTADDIRAAGLIPGIWFEYEAACSDSSAFHNTNLLLKRMGKPLTSGVRRFWDFRQTEVQEMFAQKMIGLLKECGFGYLKIDYNDTIGIGCDGAESLGEGLRAQIEAVQAFMRRISLEMPDLVIENCSSGGQRTEPSFMGLCSLASFSDTHECVQIPIIAANLHKVILPRQNLVWSVFRQTDDNKRLRYSLTATLLGRMCLSGDIAQLSKDGQQIVDDAIAYYQKAIPTIKNGFSRRYGPVIKNYAHPEGWQAIVRSNDDYVIVIIHMFGGPLPENIQVPIPEACKMIDSFTNGNACSMQETMFEHIPSSNFEGVSYLFQR